MPTKLVNCKSCGKEVDFKAKTCPHCGIDNPMPIHKGLIACLAVIIFVIILVAGVILTKEDTPTVVERVTVTVEQIDKIEKAWGGALSYHQEKLENAFNQFKPNDYQGYAQYKMKEWLPKINKNKAIMDSGWDKFGVFTEPSFKNILKIIVAMTDLNTVSISMQSYLKNRKETDLKFINEKLSEILKVSSQYEKYHPKPSK